MNGFISLGQKNRNFETSIQPFPPQARRYVLRPRQPNQKKESLNTKIRDEAVTLLHARNEAARQPQ